MVMRWHKAFEVRLLFLLEETLEVATAPIGGFASAPIVGEVCCIFLSGHHADTWPQECTDCLLDTKMHLHVEACSCNTSTHIMLTPCH